LTFMAPTPPILLGTLGMADSLILMVLALVVFGPRRLPQIGRQIGKLMYEFRKASNDFKFQMEEELRISEEADRRKKEEAERAARAALPAPTQTIEAGSSTSVPEQESVSAQPPASNPAQDPADAPEAAAAEPESRVTESQQPESHVTTPGTVPVIQPPTTGEQVQAAKPNAAIAAETPSNTNHGTEPPASPQDPTASETLTQHG
jgi:sec-independent protein translocase protein TatB